jgi:plasmid stability protein
MAQLIIRNIEIELKAKLQRRAKRHGRSMEQEVREILRDATKAEPRRQGLGTRIAALFRDIGLRDGEEIPELRAIQTAAGPWVARRLPAKRASPAALLGQNVGQ